MNSSAIDRPPVFIIKAWLGDQSLGQAVAYKAEVAKLFGEAMMKLPGASVVIEHRVLQQCNEMPWNQFVEWCNAHVSQASAKDQ